MKSLESILADITAQDTSQRRNRFAVQRTAGSMPVWQSGEGAGGQDGSFKALLNEVNPIQHVPVVGNIYRQMSGTEISPVAQFIGASLIGGLIGGALALADIAIEHETGSGVLEKAYNLVTGNEATQAPEVPDIAPTPYRNRFSVQRTAGSMPVWQANEV